MGFNATKPDIIGCQQQSHRSACIDAQSDQHRCYSFSGKNNDSSSYAKNAHMLASFCSWADLFESHFVGNPRQVFSCEALIQ